MSAMPTPTGWGAALPPAKRKGAYRLERGEIVFERLFVRLLPEELPPEAKNEDEMIGKRSKNLYTIPEPSSINNTDRPLNASYKQNVESMPDYSRPGGSDTVRDDLVEQLRTLGFRITACIIAVIFLGLCEILPAVGVTLPDMFLPDKSPAVYLSLNLALGVFCLFLCRGVFAGAWKALMDKKLDSEAVIATSSVAAVLHCAAQLVYCLVKNVPAHRVFIAPMLLALLINDIGLLFLTRRVARNFSFIALREGKRAARALPADIRFEEILHSGRTAGGRAVYSVNPMHLSDYLEYAYEEDHCEKMSSSLSKYVMLLPLVAGVVGTLVGITEHGVWAGVYAFCAVAVVCIPCARTLCLNLSLDVHAKKLLRRGIMLNGWAGVDEFGLTDTVAVSDTDLFPEGTLKLINVKPFGRDPMSDTLLCAASLAVAVGGPIAQVFEDLLGRKRGKLRPVDGLGYELGTGISGWVDNRPVLVGTRELLEAHGCPLPSKDYEEYIGSKGGKNRKIVYVAVSGVPRAALCVSYEPDAQTVAAVRNLTENGVRLVVYSCDCNVTKQFVAELYGIRENCVSILDMRFGDAWHVLTVDERDSAPALLACRDELSTLADGICAAKNLRGIFMLSSILHTVCFGLCLTFAAIICCIAPISGISPAQLMLLQLICPLISLVGLLQRPI